MKNKLVDTNLEISFGGKCQRFWIGRKLEKGKHLKTRHSARGDESNINLTDIIKEYKLGGFEFGNWLNNSERHDHVIACKDALETLSAIMGTKNLGFDHTLGVAFGARGQGRALAHYEPSRNIINLTKEKGSTSLAHEYGHALDWILGRHADQSVKGNWLTDMYKATQTGKMRSLAWAIVETIRGTYSYKKIPEGEYWRRSNEIFARAFEQYVCYKICQKHKTEIMQDIYTKYLCKSWTRYTSERAYLSESDFKKVVIFFDKLVRIMGEYMNGRKTVIEQVPVIQIGTAVKQPIAAAKKASATKKDATTKKTPASKAKTTTKAKKATPKQLKLKF